MTITVVASCPNCRKLIEAHGDWLNACELRTKECWIIECESCGHVFVHDIGPIEQSSDSAQLSDKKSKASVVYSCTNCDGMPSCWEKNDGPNQNCQLFEQEMGGKIKCDNPNCDKIASSIVDGCAVCSDCESEYERRRLENPDHKGEGEDRNG